MSILKFARVALNRCVSPVGIEIIRKGSLDYSDQKNYIPFQQIVAAAERSGLSVGDYIDEVMNKIPGATQATIDGMKRLGVFTQRISNVVEIGPGSGRYLEKTLLACSPLRYEVYETAGPWASYIETRYKVIMQHTDGRTLGATPDNSVDLAHAHKVFSSIPSLPTFSYWVEMARVCRSGGHAVFDIMTENCLDLDTFKKWANSPHETGSYPAAMPRAIAIEYFVSHQFDLIGTFFMPMPPGRTEVLVFRKR